MYGYSFLSRKRKKGEGVSFPFSFKENISHIPQTFRGQTGLNKHNQTFSSIRRDRFQAYGWIPLLYIGIEMRVLRKISRRRATGMATDLSKFRTFNVLICQYESPLPATSSFSNGDHKEGPRNCGKMIFVNVIMLSWNRS